MLKIYLHNAFLKIKKKLNNYINLIKQNIEHIQNKIKKIYNEGKIKK